MHSKREREVRALLNACVKLSYAAEEVPLDEPLSRVGLNSMKFMKLLIELEKLYDFVVEEDEMTLENFESIQKIVEYIDKKIPQEEVAG